MDEVRTKGFAWGNEVWPSEHLKRYIKRPGEPHLVIGFEMEASQNVHLHLLSWTVI